MGPKIVARQYVCIRAIEALLLQITQRFTPGVAYRVSSMDIPSSASSTAERIKGKVLKFSTVKDTNGKFEVSFSCTLQLYRILGLWNPASFKLSLNGEDYEGSFGASSTYNILVQDVIKKS
ncbi:MAG: hypothetical protein AAB351_01180 [Patescibacteria group bacterium]